jgi:hypothetical protein
MTPIPNEFTSYEFTPEEDTLARTLSTLQEAAIRNELSVCATQKLNVTFDAANPTSFGLQVAYLDGQIAAFRWLLASSDAAKQQAIQDRNPENFTN